MKLICLWFVFFTASLLDGLEVVVSENEVVESSLDEKQIEEQSMLKMESMESSGNETIENLVLKIFLVIDYSTYKYWLELENNDVNKTILSIRYMHFGIIEIVSKKYASIDTGKYRYKVKIVGIYIAQTEEMSSFSDYEKIKTDKNDGTVSYNKILGNMHAWVKNNSHILPTFGVLTVVTRYQDKGAAGLAYVGTACSNSGLAVMGKGSMEATADLACHEFGHSLNAAHDGQGNDCDGKQFFLMAPTQAAVKVNNLHTFSKCSRKYFEDFIDKMSSSMKERCFKDEASPIDEEYRIYKELLPGQRFDHDKQCQLKYGPGSYYCSLGEKYKGNVCSHLSCFNPTFNDCMVSFSGIPSLDGTLCGNKSWCINAKCVYDKKAPDFNDSCMFGDAKIVINFDGTKFKCPDLVKKPQLCLYDSNKESCCITCPRILKDYDDCPNGDKVNYCKGFVKFYGKDVWCAGAREICCKTCKEA